MQPTLLRPDEGTHPLGAKLLQHRLANNGALPTRMKMFYSWNLSSWTSTSPTDYRLRRCRRFLRHGPVCLQETKWKAYQGSRLPTHLRLPSMAALAQAVLPSYFLLDGLSLRQWNLFLVEVLRRLSKIARANFMLYRSIFILTTGRVIWRHSFVHGGFWKRRQIMPSLLVTSMGWINISPSCGKNFCSVPV